MAITDYYKDTVTFKEGNSGVDANGAPSQTFTAPSADYEDVAALVRPISSKGKVLRGKETSDKVYVVYCEQLDVTEDMRVTWNSNDYEIDSIKDPNNLNHHMEIEMSRDY